jgi:hypothetical protein
VRSHSVSAIEVLHVVARQIKIGLVIGDRQRRQDVRAAGRWLGEVVAVLVGTLGAERLRRRQRAVAKL